MAVKKIKAGHASQAGEVFGQPGVSKYPTAGSGHSQPLDQQRETGAVASREPRKINDCGLCRIDFGAASEHPGDGGKGQLAFKRP